MTGMTSLPRSLIGPGPFHQPSSSQGRATNGTTETLRGLVSRSGDGGLSDLPCFPAGPVGTRPGERRVLRHHGAPDPAKPAGLLGPRVVGAIAALAGPRPGAEHSRPLQDFFKFQGWRQDPWIRSISLHQAGANAGAERPPASRLDNNVCLESALPIQQGPPAGPASP